VHFSQLVFSGTIFKLILCIFWHWKKGNNYHCQAV